MPRTSRIDVLALRQACEDSLSVTEAAQSLGVSDNWFYALCRKHGIKVPFRERLQTERETQAAKKWFSKRHRERTKSIFPHATLT